jgi:uncharacterized membrane protein YidH (DUF202 family)
MNWTRIALLIIAVVMNYLVIDIHLATRNTANGHIGFMYMILYWVTALTLAILIPYMNGPRNKNGTKNKNGFKKFKTIDYILFGLCTPLSSLIILLFFIL